MNEFDIEIVRNDERCCVQCEKLCTVFNPKRVRVRVTLSCGFWYEECEENVRRLTGSEIQRQIGCTGLFLIGHFSRPRWIPSLQRYCEAHIDVSVVGNGVIEINNFACVCINWFSECPWTYCTARPIEVGLERS